MRATQKWHAASIPDIDVRLLLDALIGISALADNISRVGDRFKLVAEREGAV